LGLKSLGRRVLILQIVKHTNKDSKTKFRDSLDEGLEWYRRKISKGRMGRERGQQWEWGGSLVACLFTQKTHISAIDDWLVC
jgi:hypothetical protein